MWFTVGYLLRQSKIILEINCTYNHINIDFYIATEISPVAPSVYFYLTSYALINFYTTYE